MRTPTQACLLALTLCFPTLGAEPASEPATVDEAAERLDLRSLPLPEGAQMPGYRRLATLGYNIEKPADEVFAFIDKQLKDRGWEQLPGVQNMQGFISADYKHGDFLAHVSVYPGGGPGVGVRIAHKGNVPLASLPRPAGLETMGEYTSVSMYKSPDPVDQTADAIRELMLAAGWSPYGGAGDTAYFRQNAVLAHVRTMSAPGQGGATVVSYSTEMVSEEIPAPDFADGFRYSDGTTAAMFDCDKTAQEVADFYRAALKPAGWIATTDKPIEVKWKLQTIFRNQGQEMLTVTTSDFEGRTRARIEHSNAHEVARDAYLAMSSLGEKAKYRDKTWVTLPLTLPAGHTAEQQERWAVRVSTPAGGAFELAETLASSLEGAGWTRVGKPPVGPTVREHRYEKGGKRVWLGAAEPPALEPWVGVVGLEGLAFDLGG